MTQLICYCFEFTAEQLAAEIAATGTSDIPGIIADRCRRGLQACEIKHPSGRCCLREVRQAVSALKRERVDPSTTCCDGGT